MATPLQNVTGEQYQPPPLLPPIINPTGSNSQPKAGSFSQNGNNLSAATTGSFSENNSDYKNNRILSPNEDSMKIDFSDIFGNSQYTHDSHTFTQRLCNCCFNSWGLISCKDLEIKYYKFFLFLTLIMNILNLIAEVCSILYIFEKQKQSDVGGTMLFFLASFVLTINCFFLIKLLYRPTTRSALISALLILILMIVYVIQVSLYARPDSSATLPALVSFCVVFFVLQLISSVLLYRYWEFAQFHYDGSELVNLRELFLNNHGSNSENGLGGFGSNSNNTPRNNKPLEEALIDDEEERRNKGERGQGGEGDGDQETGLNTVQNSLRNNAATALNNNSQNNNNRNSSSFYPLGRTKNPFLLSYNLSQQRKEKQQQQQQQQQQQFANQSNNNNNVISPPPPIPGTTSGVPPKRRLSGVSLRKSTISSNGTNGKEGEVVLEGGQPQKRLDYNEEEDDQNNHSNNNSNNNNIYNNSGGSHHSQGNNNSRKNNSNNNSNPNNNNKSISPPPPPSFPPQSLPGSVSKKLSNKNVLLHNQLTPQLDTQAKFDRLLVSSSVSRSPSAVSPSNYSSPVKGNNNNPSNNPKKSPSPSPRNSNITNYNNNNNSNNSNNVNSITNNNQNNNNSEDEDYYQLSPSTSAAHRCSPPRSPPQHLHSGLGLAHPPSLGGPTTTAPANTLTKIHADSLGDLSNMSYFLEAGSSIIKSEAGLNNPDNLILVTEENHYSLENSVNLRIRESSTSQSNSRQSIGKAAETLGKPATTTTTGGEVQSQDHSAVW
jgi:hypothetical protein